MRHNLRLFVFAFLVPSAAQASPVLLDHGVRWSGEAGFATGPGIHLVAHPEPTLVELDAAGRAFFDRHPALFGIGSSDLVSLIGQPIGEGHAMVSYQQTRDGLPVLDTRVHLIFRGPALVLARSTASDAQRAGDFALDAVAALARTGLRPVRHRQERALLARDGVLRPVWHFTIATAVPEGAFDVAVDAETGEVLRWIDLIEREVAQIDAMVSVPGGARARLAFPYWSASAGPDGRGDAPLGPLTVSVNGPLGRLDDDLAPPALEIFSPQGTGGVEEFTWPEGLAPQEQLDAWVWTHTAIEHGRQLAPELAWLNEPLGIHVNHDDGSGFPYCNAFYKSDDPLVENAGDIHFFRAGGNSTVQCTNTASIPHVVVHEWGHGFHDHLNPNRTRDDIDRSIGEGIGDYVAATIFDDPVMPIDAIFAPDSPTTQEPRLLDNDFQYPGHLRNLPDGRTDVHWNGQLWSGAWWDLRSALRERYGAVVGTQLADDLHARVVRVGPVWTDVWANAIVLDDDDDDPSNGSPHSCEINAAFSAHGLTAATLVPGRGSLRFDHAPAASTVAGDLAIAVGVETIAGCGEVDAGSVELVYSVGSAAPVRLPMTAAGARFEALVPALAAGDTLRYSFAARATDGTIATWPAGGGAFAVAVDGEVMPLATWDFEDGGAGWTHGSSSAVADDWQFGAPTGKAGDPAGAGGGAVSAGTDLGEVTNGAYDPVAATSWLDSPVLPCDGECGDIRLRFRRHLSLGAGDAARVRVGERIVWETSGPLEDAGWGWQEISLSALTGEIQVRFELESDGTGEAGGWNVDDVTLFLPAAGEEADVSGGCGCGAGGGAGAPGGLALLLLLVLARARRCSVD